MSRSTSRLRSRLPISRSINVSDHTMPFTSASKVVVQNIPYETSWQELKDMFKKDVGDVTYVELLTTPDGKSKGKAVIEFKDPDDARKAIDMHKKKIINDRVIFIREYLPQDELARERQPIGFRKCHGVGLNGGVGSLGPVTWRTELPMTNIVFVANLDYNVSELKLKSLFKLAGNVMKAELKVDRNGKSRGIGRVYFRHPMDAAKAVSILHDTFFYGRKLIVHLDKCGNQDIPKLTSGLQSFGMDLGLDGQLLRNMEHLQDVAQASGQSDVHKYDGPGELAAALDELEGKINKDPLSNKEVRNRPSLERVESIISGAALMADSSCISGDRRETIEQALQDLLTKYMNNAYVRHPELAAAFSNRDYALKQVDAVNTIPDVAQASGQSDVHKYDGPGELAAALDELEGKINKDPLFNKKVRNRPSLERVESIISGAALMADSSFISGDRRETKEQALQDLLTKYMNNKANKEESHGDRKNSLVFQNILIDIVRKHRKGLGISIKKMKKILVQENVVSPETSIKWLRERVHSAVNEGKLKKTL